MPLEPTRDPGPTGHRAGTRLVQQSDAAGCPRKPGGRSTPDARQASGQGQLARQLAGWTSNAIASVVIVLASIACGRQIVRWWAEDPIPPASQPAEVIGWPDDFSGPRTIVFGDCPWTMERQLVHGSAEEVQALLQTACRQALEQAKLPGDAPGPLERRLLGRLARRDHPVESGARWAVYRLAEPLVMIAGLCCPEPLAAESAGPSAQHCVASPGSRVVIWALGVPTGAKTWAAYVFRRIGGTDASESLAQFSTPEGVHRLMGVSTPDGGFLLVVEGADPIAHWREQFDRSLVQSGWQSVEAWRWSGAAWTRRYADSRAGWLELYLAPRDEGGWVGLMTRRPGAGPLSNTLSSGTPNR